MEVAKQLRQGHALGGRPVDCGAMCMPGLAEKVGQLVEDAVHGGAKVASCPLKRPDIQIYCEVVEGPTYCQAWR